MRPDEFTQWCACGGDHCIRLQWFSDEPDATYMDLIDSLGSPERSIWRPLRSAWKFLVRGSVCNYANVEVVLAPEDRRRLAEWLLREKAT